MEFRALSSSRPGLLLLFALLCGVRLFTKASPTGPYEWTITDHGYDPMALNCSGMGLEIRPSDTFTHALDLSFSDLTGIRRSHFLPRSPSIAKVNLSHWCIVEVQEAAFAGVSDLEELDLSSNCLHTIRDGTLQGLGRLKTLDLRHNRISEVHRYAFTGLDAVQIIWLQNNKLDTIPEAVSGLAALRVLSLANNQISWVDSRSFHGCRSLTALHLQHNRIAGVSVDAFRHLIKLQMLNLGTNLLDTMPGSTLESLWARGADIRLHDNPWRCDCSLAELRGRAPSWLTDRVWCHGGGLHGAPLSSLGLGQLECKRTLRVSQTLTANIEEGAGLRIPCGNHSEGGDAQYWQTPFGRLENSSVQGSVGPVMMLRDGSIELSSATPYHTGLYYCLRAAREERVIQPYWVECVPSAVSAGARPRKSREAREAGGYQGTVSAGHFAAAVGSAVVVSLLAGFAAGAFSRTYLSRGLQWVRLRGRPDSGGVRMGTLPGRHGNETFQRGGGSEATPTVATPPEDDHAQRVRPDARAALGAAYLEGSDSGRESQVGEEEEEEEEEEARNGGTSERGAREPRGTGREGSAEEAEPSSRGGARPSKRRVIKVYNYDEEGNKYGHIRETADEGVARAKQRTLSLTRLNAIMASATAPGNTPEPPHPGDGTPAFQLSI